MSDATTTSVIKILGKEYQIACAPEEERALQAAAQHLDEQMRTIRESGKVIGLERIAIMAALNMSHELLSRSGDDDGQSAQQQQRLNKLTTTLDDTLQRLKQIKI